MSEPAAPTDRTHARRSYLVLIAAAVVIGVIDALVLRAFEWAVNDGTHWIWDDVFRTDDHRWGVVPLAVVLGVALSALMYVTKRPRLIPPSTDALADDDEDDSTPPTLPGIGIVIAIGLMSLLAGASLGPEATLVAVAAGLGAWIGNRTTPGPQAKLLQLASIGALMVAFLGSFVMVALPLLLLAKQRRLNLISAVPVLVAGGTAFGTLWLLDHSVEGYGSVPLDDHFGWEDVAVALGVGFVAALFGVTLKWSIRHLYRLAAGIEARLAWPIAGAVFGLVLGLLYLAGGETVEFSGSVGTGLLVSRQPPYGAAMLVVILLVKLAATAWSLATGYRGGLVFPSVFAGVAVSLIALAWFDASPPGVMIGAIAGVFGAMTGPVVAMIFLVAIIPIRLFGIALAGIVGAAIGQRACAALARRRSAPAA